MLFMVSLLFSLIGGTIASVLAVMLMRHTPPKISRVIGIVWIFSALPIALISSHYSKSLNAYIVEKTAHEKVYTQTIPIEAYNRADLEEYLDAYISELSSIPTPRPLEPEPELELILALPTSRLKTSLSNEVPCSTGDELRHFAVHIDEDNHLDYICFYINAAMPTRLSRYRWHIASSEVWEIITTKGEAKVEVVTTITEYTDWLTGSSLTYEEKKLLGITATSQIQKSYRLYVPENETTR